MHKYFLNYWGKFNDKFFIGDVKQIEKKYEKILRKLEGILDNPDIPTEKKKDILMTIGYEEEIKPLIAKRNELQERLVTHENEARLTRRAF